MQQNKITLFMILTLFSLVGLYLVAVLSLVWAGGWWLFPIKLAMVTAALVLSFQGVFTLFWMLYAWEDPEKIRRDLPPAHILPPQKTFSILIPARFESEVIATTVRSFARLDYDPKLMEVIILCRDDDPETLAQAKTAIAAAGVKFIRVEVFSSDLASKPSALNIGLGLAKHQIVGVFDAEDEPKPQILAVVNTIFMTKKPVVVQGGVQLMNYQTAWYSPLNVLEYYFWYKSALHLFSRLGVIPLGGNTVFFDKIELKRQGGWQECLTEDAEIGLRFSSANQKMHIMYDPALTTAEESPATLQALLKQRTRWNQGFFQIFLAKSWVDYPDLKRRLFALYFLMMAQLNTLNLALVGVSLTTFMIKLPVAATMVVLFPLYLLSLQLLCQLLGYYEFSKDYHQKFSVLVALKIIIGFIPYQIVLAVGAARASVRQIRNQIDWEKTNHQNLHRLATT